VFSKPVSRRHAVVASCKRTTKRATSRPRQFYFGRRCAGATPREEAAPAAERVTGQPPCSRTSRGSERLERVLAAIGHLKVGDWEAPSWHEIAISSCTPASWARARCSSRCSSRFRVSCAGATSLCFPAFCFHRARPCYHRRRPGQTSPADAAPLRSSLFGVRPLYYGSLLVPLHQLVPQRQRALRRLRLMPSKRARAAGG